MNHVSRRCCCAGTVLLALLVFSNVSAQVGSNEEAQQLEQQVKEVARQGNYQEAIELERRALAIKDKISPQGAGTAFSLSVLGFLYTQIGAYGQAEPLYLRSLAICEKVLGPEHPDTATVLSDLAGLYQQTGAYAKAEPLYQRALAIREKVQGPEHSETVESLSSLASLYYATGAYAKAEPLYQRALATREKVLGPEHPATATTLQDLGELYLASAAYAKAEPLLQRSLAIREKVLGPEQVATAASLDSLGRLYQASVQYAKAEPLLQRSLAIREKVLGREHPDTATALDNLGALYLATGAYAKAEPLYQRALAIDEKALGPGHPQTADTLHNLAELYFLTARYAQAESLYQRALAIHERALGRENPTTLVSLNNLAEVYQATGAYAKAEPLLQRALAIRKKVLGPEHPDVAQALNNLAGLYFETGAYPQAEDLYMQALAIRKKVLGPEHPDTAQVLNNLASLYDATGTHATATMLYLQALAIRKKALGLEHPDTVQTLNNLGNSYESGGDYAKAEPVLQQALAIREKLYGPEHPATAVALNNLALLYSATGAYAKAEPLYQRAIKINEHSLGPTHERTAACLENLAELYEATGAYAKAQPLSERAQIIDEKNLQRFLLSDSEARGRAYLQRIKRATFVKVSLSLANPTASSIELGLTSVLQYKGRELDAVSGSAAILRRSLAPADRTLFDQLASVAQQLSTLTFGSSAKLSPVAVREQLEALSQHQDELQTKLASRSSTLLHAVASVTLENVRRAIPDGAMLVEWFRHMPVDLKTHAPSPPRYVAFLLKKTGEPVAVDLGDAKSIDDLVREYRRVLRDPSTTYYADVARELSDKLIKPLNLQLAQGGRLLLSPDGELNVVPFAALMDGHGDYLAQHFEITYLTSGRDLLRMSGEPRPQSSAVLVANPSYGQPHRALVPAETPKRSSELDHNGLVFAPLPGTAQEAAAIQSLLKLDAHDVLTGDRATEERLRMLHGPRILHLATHAFFLKNQETAAKALGLDSNSIIPLGENPLLRAGLALAGANLRRSGASDDGILTAAEVAQLDLVGTQLVVLSACETGVGTIQAGDGVFGLRRALVLAGAQAQLVSLWKVSDQATQELMADYYQRLLKGEGRSEALRDAQLKMMANPARRHPYFWAAFILSGDWTPLTPASGHRASLARTSHAPGVLRAQAPEAPAEQILRH